MNTKNSYHIVHSNNKHESLIPKFDVRKCSHDFFKARKASANAVRTPQKNKMQLDELTDSIAMNLYYKIEKRFIIHGDFNQQDESLLTEQQRRYIPFLLLNFLLKQFQQKEDYNSLNSAVRIVDHLQKKSTSFSSQQRYLFELLSAKELSYLSAIYNDSI